VSFITDIIDNGVSKIFE